ncbi:hypothetical protein L6164_030391 [Bauhinia variegata]|uniref:Uncharacterized protein n=1 Tax=Bauhinia variegata TaxID=167791 RepID=A0ACB9LD30_BAUVA|nr:hypothetical protein L6164_030391 [Bauhinia variegata]
MEIWDSLWVMQLIQMLGIFSFWISLSKIKTLFSRAISFGDRIIKSHSKVWAFLSFNGLVISGSLMSILVVISWAYSYVSPNSHSVIQSYEVPNSSVSVTPSYQIPKSNVSTGATASGCNVFEGSWIRDDSYPLYDASHCPFAERGFNCLANGRKDRGYTKWRWKPKNCDIPRFDAPRLLEQLRGKRVVFVGDSLSRTQWESLICLLMTAVKDKNSVYEINHNKINKQIRFLGVIFTSYNIRIDFYRSIFLVKSGPPPKHAPKRVKTTLRLDKLDDISREWVDSDVLIFNSGHWWTRSKLFDMGWYFQVGNSVKLGMPISSAFNTALQTWASWVETTINANRTRIFFRTFETSHWSGHNRNSCKVTRKPSKKTNGRDRNPFSDMIFKAVNKMNISATLVHVTPMDAHRSDGHVGTWSDKPSVPDCSHWCLPGVPDMWNEILFSYLLPQHGAH